LVFFVRAIPVAPMPNASNASDNSLDRVIVIDFGRDAAFAVGFFVDITDELRWPNEFTNDNGLDDIADELLRILNWTLLEFGGDLVDVDKLLITGSDRSLPLFFDVAPSVPDFELTDVFDDINFGVVGLTAIILPDCLSSFWPADCMDINEGWLSFKSSQTPAPTTVSPDPKRLRLFFLDATMEL